MKTPGRLAAAFGRLLDFILPPRCPVSGAVVDAQGMLSPEIWKQMDFVSPPFCPSCGAPLAFDDAGAAEGLADLAAAPAPVSAIPCSACLADPPLFASARSAAVYNEASRALILRFKNGDHLAAVHSFVPWLARAGAEMLAEADFLIPVPLHYYRLLKRRYNQSALLAQALAKASGVPCLPDALLRARATPSQGPLGLRARSRNVRGAFAVPPRRAARLAGRTLVIIDDVYTTGATTRECARALLKAGAAKVHVLTVARTVRD
jgi:ComF family protein